MVIDFLDIHPIDFGMLVMNLSLYYNHQFLCTVPISSHMNECCIGMKYILQRLTYVLSLSWWLLLVGTDDIVQ